jgi:hypothetical protein
VVLAVDATQIAPGKEHGPGSARTGDFRLLPEVGRGRRNDSATSGAARSDSPAHAIGPAIPGTEVAWGQQGSQFPKAHIEFAAFKKSLV